MLIPNALAIQTLNGHAGSRPSSSGNGKIQIANDTVYLITGSEKFTLPPNTAATFSDGDQVRYVLDKNMIILMHAEDAEKPPTSVSDILQLSPSVKTSERPPVEQLIIPISSKPSGMYLFADTGKLLEFIGQKENPEVAALVKILKGVNPVIAVSVLVSESDGATAVIIPVEKASAALTSLIKNFSSRLMQTLSETTLENILSANGELDTVRLAELDKACMTRDIPPLTTRSGSASAQETALYQWLTSALRHPSPDLLEPLAPRSQAQQLVSDFTISEKSITDRGTIRAQSVTLDETSFDQLPEDNNFMRSPFLKLGFNLENTLKNGERVDTKDTSVVPESIKSELLKLTKESTPQAQHSGSREIYQTEHAQPASVLKVALQILQQISDAVSGLPAPPSVDGKHATAIVTAPASKAVFTNAIATLEQVTIQLPAALPKSHPSTPVLKQAEKTLRSLLPVLHEFSATLRETHNNGTKLQSDPETLTRQFKEITTPGISKNTLSPIRIPELVSLLFSSITSVTEHIETLYRMADPRQQNEPGLLLHHRSGTAIPESITSQPSVVSGGISNLIQSLPSLLDTLESLQLLARPAPTQDGTQQLIALPIKFGENISEITVQFRNHSKKKSRGKTASHFSAVIDVVPPFLGHINSHLDYRRSKQLNITMTFERKISYRWFTLHKQEIAAALQPSFNHPVHIDFGLTRNKGKIQDQIKPISDSLIDLRA